MTSWSAETAKQKLANKMQGKEWSDKGGGYFTHTTGGLTQRYIGV